MLIAISLIGMLVCLALFWLYQCLVLTKHGQVTIIAQWGQKAIAARTSGLSWILWPSQQIYDVLTIEIKIASLGNIDFYCDLENPEGNPIQLRAAEINLSFQIDIFNDPAGSQLSSRKIESYYRLLEKKPHESADYNKILKILKANIQALLAEEVRRLNIRQALQLTDNIQTKIFERLRTTLKTRYGQTFPIHLLDLKFQPLDIVDPNVQDLIEASARIKFEKEAAKERLVMRAMIAEKEVEIAKQQALARAVGIREVGQARGISQLPAREQVEAWQIFEAIEKAPEMVKGANSTLIFTPPLLDNLFRLLGKIAGGK